MYRIHAVVVASFRIFVNISTMVNARKWLAYGVSATFILASISCVIIALRALCKEANTKAGNATIQVKPSSLSLAYC